MNIGDLYFALRAQDRQLQADVKKAGDKAGTTLGGSLSASLRKSFSGQEFGKGIVQGLGLAGGLGAANLLAGGLSRVTDFIGDSIEAASALNEEVSKSNVIFGENSEEVQAWAAGMATSFGQSKRAALETASTFAGLFDTVGFSLDDAKQKAIALTELGSDLASFFNTDVKTATDALRSGLSGESEPLRRFNVFLSETAVSAELVAMGQEKVNGQWTEGQKVAARYRIILKQTASAQGNYAMTATDLANSQRTLNAELENTQAQLGEKFLPVAKQVTQWQLDFLEGGELVLRFLGELGTGFGFLADKATTALDVLTFWDEQTHGLGKSIGEFDVATSKATLSLGRMADAAKDDIFDITQATIGLRFATERTGLSAEEAADAFDTAMEGITDSVEEATSALEQAAADVISSYFDPIEERAELAALDQERRNLERIIGARETGKVEREESEETLRQVMADTIEVLASLAAAGDAEAAARLEAFAASAKASGKLSAQQIADLDKLLLKIRMVKITLTEVARLNFQRDASKDDRYVPGKASGGPVWQGNPYWVGETAPELFVPEVNGHIFTQSQAEGMGGMAHVSNNYITIEGPAKSQDPLALMYTLRRAQDTGVLK